MALRRAIKFTPVSVRLLGLTDGGSGRAADGRSDRSGDERASDGAGGRLLFDGLTAGGDPGGCEGPGEGQGKAYHG